MIHDITIPPLTRTLGALGGILAKAEAHCEAKKIDPQALLVFRLFPDMFPFTRQVQLACDFAVRIPARLSGAEMPSYPDTETSFAELQARVARARDDVSAYGPARFDGAAERAITVKTRVAELHMTGLQFLTQYALPQVHFHATTAYNILRHNGVDLGKRDYMGA
jgi:uncharacterized protein